MYSNIDEATGQPLFQPKMETKQAYTNRDNTPRYENLYKNAFDM